MIREIISFYKSATGLLSRDIENETLGSYLKKNHSSIIKTKSVAAQGTTTQRNAITVEQQFRWHKFIDSGIAFLRQKNTGICKCGCGKTFGELIDHFVVSGDETCVMASKTGVVRIIGAAAKKKHEAKIQDCRESITMFRTGNAAGDTGPTIFLVKGKKIRSGYRRKGFLVTFGAKTGSEIFANKSAFMDTETEKKTVSIYLS